jgi:hypothetical protein
MACTSCKQFGGGTLAAPLSYSNPNYQEPSASAGSNRLVSEALLARPSLNHTGGKRHRRKCARKHKHTRKCSLRNRKGGFYPSVMGPLIGNGSRLLPAAAVQGYRMVRNYSGRKSRKDRK